MDDAREGAKGIMAGTTLREGRTFFIPHPEVRPGLRDCFMVCGASGAGKSSYAALFAQAWMDTHYPRSGRAKWGTEARPFPIVLVCPDAEDPAFKGLPLLHISPEMMAKAADDGKPITIESIVWPDHPVLLIVDDVESLSDKKQLSAMKVLVDAVLTRGRKKQISCLYISHRPADNTKTKTVLQPVTSSNRNISYCAETYARVPQEFRARLKSEAAELGRWALIKQDADPRLLITDHSVAIVDDDDIRRGIQRARAAERLAVKREAAAAAASPHSEADDDCY